MFNNLDDKQLTGLAFLVIAVAALAWSLYKIRKGE